MNFLVLIKCVLLAIILNGCGVADYFTLGKNQSYCEEVGCDYRDAGVCDDPFNIIQNKAEANKVAYSDIKCKKGEK